MTIYVTQKDIDEGELNDCNFCPIALAMTRRGFKDVQVDSKTFTHVVNGVKVLRDLPEKAQNFITMFDAHLKVGPIRFEVDDA